MSKVKFDVIKPWITQRITELLGMEDDVIVEFVFNQLEAEKVLPPKYQILVILVSGRGVSLDSVPHTGSLIIKINLYQQLVSI
jgi:hypothetical protein